MDKKVVWGEIVAGVILFLLSNILAVVFRYDKFYVLLVIGITLALKGVYKLHGKKELLNLLNFTEVYLSFIIIGFIADFVFGLYITHLWSYPTYTLMNYLVLYLVCYPFGGLVMVYSFALLELLFIKKPRERLIDYIHSMIFAKAVILLGAAGIIGSFFISSYQGFFIYLFYALFTYGILVYLNLRISTDDLVERLFERFLKYALLILVVSYSQAFLHEFPNVYAREWVYQNIPFNNLTLLGIPVIVILGGWIFLLIAPYEIFELILDLNKKRAGKSFFKPH